MFLEDLDFLKELIKSIFRFISYIHLLKSSQKGFLKGRLNLEGDWTKHLPGKSGPIRYVSMNLPIGARRDERTLWQVIFYVSYFSEQLRGVVVILIPTIPVFVHKGN